MNNLMLALLGWPEIIVILLVLLVMGGLAVGLVLLVVWLLRRGERPGPASPRVFSESNQRTGAASWLSLVEVRDGRPHIRWGIYFLGLSAAVIGAALLNGLLLAAGVWSGLDTVLFGVFVVAVVFNIFVIHAFNKAGRAGLLETPSTGGATPSGPASPHRPAPNTLASTSPCPRCGATLSPDSPQGLCPRCVMGVGLATQTEATGEFGPHGTKIVPPPEAEVAKRFPHLEILGCLGHGGMGVVYKARQPKLNRLVALKILSPEKGADPKFAERFLREAQALARLSHPNIVTVHDFGEADGMFFLLMEFVDGMTLRQLLREGRMKPEEALAIVPPICEALQFAHEQGVVHRDIKPENVLLDKQGRVKIADFGIAKIINPLSRPADTLSPSDGEKAGVRSEGLTQDHILGTPHYMAPEQVEKPATVDHRADIYSLGVVFYEMLTGELPLGKFQPPSKKVRVDVRLDEIVLRALEKEPELRYQQASVLRTDVETVAASPGGAEASGKAPFPTRPETTHATPPRGKAAWYVAGFVLLGLMVAIAFFSLWERSSGSAANSPHTLRRLPTAEVIQAGLAEPDSPWAWQELEQRAKTRRLSTLEAEALLNELTTWMRLSHPGGYDQPAHWFRGLLDELGTRRLVTDKSVLAFLEALHGQPKCEPLVRVRENERQPALALTCRWRSPWHEELFGLKLLNEMRSITIEGKEAAWRDVHPNCEQYEFYGSLELPALAPGKYSVKFEIESALIPKQDLVGLAPDTLSPDWPSAKRRWTRVCESELIVYPKQTEIVRLTEDPALDPVASGALSVKQVIIRSDGNRATAAAAVVVLEKDNTGQKLLVPVSFDVTLRVGGENYHSGHFWSAAKGTRGGFTPNRSSRSELSADINPLGAEVQAAEVVLTPNPKAVEREGSIDRIWGREIVFPHVRLVRQDLRQAGKPYFGPVIERVVNSYGAEAGNQGLDFENGTQFSISERPLYNDELRVKWIADHGIDLLVVNKGGIKWNLVGLDFKLARLSEGQWEDATPETLRRALDGVVMETEDGWRFHAINDRLEKPLVFALQTGSGTIGLLQITGFTDNPLGMKLRYKLVSPTGGASHAASTPAPNPKTVIPELGPVIERVLNDPDDRQKEETLRLATGTLSSELAGAEKMGGGRLRRLVASQGDVYADYDDFVGRRWALITAGLKLSDLSPRQWDSTTVSDLSKALEVPTVVDQMEHHGAILYLLPEGLSPMTFAFQTRHGDRGLLQITGFTDNPRAVKLRYKLMQPAAKP